ncbi:isopentenyl phosphate kinase family protein [Halobaculum sp. CBA1158]|uniref:isopentenyl phosphate kinase n=1 Tax=Halobaculum sp. CBA1158 TaxID=2904243 RepID=UPI001F3AFB48|nr:isopentenyl phosphate kinase [Halobaculum sp. CBA1158]UIO98760.1 isopentenyl phosphate kinase family protein [Halobaculum sp. CBA1158]
MTVILKLGGSVITEKDRPKTLDGETLASLAAAIGDAEVDDLVVVHGGGSFGHHHAAEHGVSTTAGIRDVDGVMDVHGAMTTLNRFVLSRLHTEDVPAVPVHPLSAAARDADGELTLMTDQVATMLEEGFVPVLHGDGVVHAGEGVTVLSGDELVTALATALDAERVGLCSTVPGVLDGDDEVIPAIESFDEVADVLGVSDATDVTGGMAAKVRELLGLGSPASVFGPESLEGFLAGDDVGTRIG